MIAQSAGFVGSKQDWLDSLVGADGLSAYESAAIGGYAGTEEQFYQDLYSVGQIGVAATYGDDLDGDGQPDLLTEATGIYALLDEISQNGGSNTDALAALEDILGSPAVADDPLTTDIDESSPATGVYAQSGTGVNDAVLEQISGLYDYIDDSGFASGASLQEVADVLGKPAELVTQADIDAVNQMVVDNTAAVLAGNEVNYDARYDLNNDGIVNYLDDQLFNELYAGEDSQYNTYVQGIDPNSAFANTGVFDTLAYDREQTRLSDIALQEEIDAQAALDAEIAQNTQTQINAQIQAQQDAERRSLLYALAASQPQQAAAPEIETVPFKQRYNWESIFASEEEEAARSRVTPYGSYTAAEPKAAATGGLITDESDELLALLGLE